MIFEIIQETEYSIELDPINVDVWEISQLLRDAFPMQPNYVSGVHTAKETLTMIKRWTKPSTQVQWNQPI